MIRDVCETSAARAKMMLISATDHAADVRILVSAVLGDDNAEEPVQIEQVQAEGRSMSSTLEHGVDKGGRGVSARR